MRLPVNQALPLGAILLATVSCGAEARSATTSPPAAPSGPAADYPVTIGEPFTLGDTTWTPADQLNYDAVGYAIAGDWAGVTGAHKTLPLPSYVEVTSLETGRTILVRLQERGPMANDALIALSSAASTQLGLAPGARSPVRVRRVNPPEIERAALRGGGEAPARMDTPESLLKVLRRKLTDQSPLIPASGNPPSLPGSILRDTPAQLAHSEAVKPTQAAVPAPVERSVAKGTIIVQVAAFSSADRAQTVAAQLGGRVSQSQRYWRVRLGPFVGRGEASAALEKAKSAGYRDARIQRAD